MQNPLKTLANALRGSTAFVTRAFEAGRAGRRLAAIPAVSVALNTLIMRYGRTVLARSRYLCTNNPYTVAAKETFVSALVGTGIRPSTLGETADSKTKVHEDWGDWCDIADADGITSFQGLQELGAAELFEAGEYFVRMVQTAERDDGLVPLKLKLIPSEMLPYTNIPLTTQPATGNMVQMGIEFDPSGNRVAYHFLTINPTDITRTDQVNYQSVRVLAEDVLHVFRPLRIGQVRGIPHTLASLISSAMLDMYDDAELERKRTAALFAAFVTKKDPDDDGPLGASSPVQGATNGAGGSGNPGDPESFKMQPGIVVDLLPGEDVKFSTPADVGGGYDPFQYRMLCRLAAGFGVPYASMSGDLKAANYGSIRAGLVQFRRRVEMMQFNMLIPQMMGPVWVRWLKLYTFFGLSPWPLTDWADAKLRRLHMRVKWLCPRWDWVDPLKDAQAEKLLVDNGFKSRWDTVEEMGSDPDETDERILEAQNSEDDKGLRIIRFTSGAAAKTEADATPSDAPDSAAESATEDATDTTEKP